MDVGLLVMRDAVGVLLVGHGTQKLFRWFGDPRIVPGVPGAADAAITGAAVDEAA